MLADAPFIGSKPYLAARTCGAGYVAEGITILGEDSEISLHWMNRDRRSRRVAR